MTGYTPIYNLPYPQASDLVSAYPGTGQDLAEEVETVLAAKAASSSVGLVKIGTYSASAQSALNINDCFTSTYRNYRVIMRVSSSDGNGYTINLRAGGTNNTAASYDQSLLSQNSTTVTGTSVADGTNWAIICSANSELHTFDFCGPQTNAITIVHAITGNSATGAPQLRVRYLQHDDAYQADGLGLTVYTAGQTITALVEVYGYNI